MYLQFIGRGNPQHSGIWRHKLLPRKDTVMFILWERNSLTVMTFIRIHKNMQKENIKTSFVFNCSFAHASYLHLFCKNKITTC